MWNWKIYRKHFRGWCYFLWSNHSTLGHVHNILLMVQKSCLHHLVLFQTLQIVGNLPYQLVQEFFHQEYGPGSKMTKSPIGFPEFWVKFRQKKPCTMFWVKGDFSHQGYHYFWYVLIFIVLLVWVALTPDLYLTLAKAKLVWKVRFDEILILMGESVDS